MRKNLLAATYYFFAAALLLHIAPLRAQSNMPMTHAPAARSTTLTITGPGGKQLVLTPAEFAALPHKTISVYNAHTKANETYSGVVLSDLLAKVGTPVGEAVRGKLYRLYLLATGTDNYSVVYSLAETDPANHTGDVIIADAMNGQPLAADGAFKIVSSEEKRPARWVRNLASITVKTAE